MSDVLGNTSSATYAWHEAIERIAACDDMDELNTLCLVLNEEKKKYALYFLKVIRYAIGEKVKMLMSYE